MMITILLHFMIYILFDGRSRTNSTVSEKSVVMVNVHSYNRNRSGENNREILCGMDGVMHKYLGVCQAQRSLMSELMTKPTD